MKTVNATKKIFSMFAAACALSACAACSSAPKQDADANSLGETPVTANADASQAPVSQDPPAVNPIADAAPAPAPEPLPEPAPAPSKKMSLGAGSSGRGH